MNWGKGITIAIILFMGYILYFVFKMVAQDVDLVTEDYYVKELAYQDQIYRIENSNKMDISSVVRMNSDSVYFIFKNATNLKNGELQMYRPSNPNEDIFQSFQLNNKSEMAIPLKDLKAGKYIAKMSFKVNKMPCYSENIIVVP